MLSDLATKADLRLNIIGIDPGTQNLGVCIGYTDYINKKFVVTQSFTLNVVDLIHKSYGEMVDTHSRNITMVTCIHAFITRLLMNYPSDWVICESPYMNSRFPVAYALLTLCTQSVETAVKDYSQTMVFDYIDPATVKKTVNVKGNSSDKSLVQKAVLMNPSIELQCNTSVLDEHAFDAIAIAFSGYLACL